MMKKNKITESGYLNPIPKVHIKYFNNAKALVYDFFVMLNNDHKRALKGSKEFHYEAEQFFIVFNIKSLAHSNLFIYKDRMVCKTIEKIARYFGETYEFIFANGVDQKYTTIPELPIYGKRELSC